MIRSIQVYGGTDGTVHNGTITGEWNKSIIKGKFRDNGYVGYLSGYRTTTIHGVVDSIMAFFKERPTDAEIYRRRQNGFKAATWHWL